MDDFIFGTLRTDELRLARLRHLHAGVVHFNRIEPLDPHPDEPITLHVTLGTQLNADRVTCYYTTDGSTPQGRRGVAGNGDALALELETTEWDVLEWGYLTHWCATIPPQSEGTKVTYKIGAWPSHAGDETFADNQVPESANATRFAFNVDTFVAPEWIRNAIIYQIFLDRFYPGAGKTFTGTHPRQFMGGTLRGVLDKLGYLAELGVNCLWLSPIFATHEYHGYHITDYRNVEPRFGTNADFSELVRRAHAADIRIILDFVPNHSSHQHPHFVSAREDPNSAYSEWYTFRRWPDEYAMFFTSKSLPQLNLEHPLARKWMIDNACFWLAQGADGFRLDYANGPSHNFWVDFRRITRALAPEGFTVGEIVESSEVVRSYAGRLDGSLDFIFLQAVRSFVAYDQIDAAALEVFLARHEKYFGREFVLPTFLDNHDMNRYLWAAQNDKARLRLAATMQFTLPQPPIIYYGTEIGMSQEKDVRDPSGFGDAEARRPVSWDNADRQLLVFYQKLVSLRKKHPSLRQGERIPLVASGGVLAYAMRDANEVCFAVLNNSASAQDVTLPVSSLASDGTKFRDAFESSVVSVENGALRLHLKARQSMVLEIL